jgi:hypothetical protein
VGREKPGKSFQRGNRCWRGEPREEIVPEALASLSNYPAPVSPKGNARLTGELRGWGWVAAVCSELAVLEDAGVRERCVRRGGGRSDEWSTKMALQTGPRPAVGASALALVSRCSRDHGVALCKHCGTLL